MKPKLILRLIALAAVISLFIASCNLIPSDYDVNVNIQATINAQVGVEQNTLDTVQNAIDAMNAAPGNWGSTMSDLIDQLSGSGSKFLNEVTSAYNQALGQTQVTAFCSVDFIGHRLVEQLQAITYEIKTELHNLNSAYPAPSNPPALLPVVCSTDPDVITVGETMFVRYYGYDFDTFGKMNFTADLYDSNSGQFVKLNYGSVSTNHNYELVVDIQNPPYSPTPQQGLQLVLRFKGQQVSDEEEGMSALSMQFPNVPTQPPALPPITINHFCQISQEASHPSLTVNVPSGYKVVGGGAFDDWQGAGNLLVASYPSGVDSWTGVGKDHDAPDPSSITVCALALYDPGNLWNVHIFSSSSSADEHPIAQVSVPSTYTMVGGGARVDYGNGQGNILFASYPLDADTWVAKSKDHVYPSPAVVWAYAIGITVNAGNPYSKFPDVHIFQGNPVSASALLNANVKMDSGYTLLSGGARINYQGPGMMLTESYPLNDYSGWIAIGKDQLNPDSGSMTVYAIGFKQP